MKHKFTRIVSLACACVTIVGISAFATELVDGPIYPPASSTEVLENDSMIAPYAQTQIIALKDCKLYAGAGTSTGVVGTMQKGLVRAILNTDGNFYKVKVDGANVWVHKNNVSNVNDVTVKVTANKDCSVYKDADTTSDVVATIPEGTTRTALNYSGNFYKIKMNGNLGWIKMNTGNFAINITTGSVTPDPDPGESTAYDKIAALAQTKIGCAYVYGATGPSQFDCSGLAYYCYRQNGITSLPRTSKDQYSKCIKVAKSALKPGYLVFFDCSDNDGVVDHVGIYIGNNEIVHAANSRDGVRKDSLTSNYYTQHYVGSGYFK